MDNLKKSIWMEGAKVPHFGPLNEDLLTDVCVVGAGISGLTTAYLLAREGKKVVVIDDGPIGWGESGRTTAHWTYALDDRYFEIEKLHGVYGSQLAFESHNAAIDLCESILLHEHINCNFQRLDGYLFLQEGDDPENLERELKAGVRAGITDLEMVSEVPGLSWAGNALKFSNQAQLHPLRYLSGIAEAIVRLGGRIYTNTHARDIKEYRVETESGLIISAENIVVATNTPVNDRVFIHTKQAAYRTYVIGMKIPKHSFPRILLWETGFPKPYHYVRLLGDYHNSDYDVLMVGGEDHKTGQSESASHHFSSLENWAREKFPQAGAVLHEWSGQIMEPVDGMGFIGRNPGDNNVFIITGDSGNGMTHGTLGAKLITDLILGRANPWSTLYDPSRRTLKAAREYIKENINTAAQYADWVKPGDADSIHEISENSGAVVREGTHLVAAFRDESGLLHKMSAVCPHLGGIVRWNNEEGSWDCPCHGSRFEASTGAVLNGPAISGLKSLDDKDITVEDPQSPRRRDPNRSVEL